MKKLLIDLLEGLRDYVKRRRTSWQFYGELATEKAAEKAARKAQRRP